MTLLTLLALYAIALARAGLRSLTVTRGGAPVRHYARVLSVGATGGTGRQHVGQRVRARLRGHGACSSYAGRRCRIRPYAIATSVCKIETGAASWTMKLNILENRFYRDGTHPQSVKP